MDSILTKDQKKILSKDNIKVIIRYDDECDNGYNTFSITAEVYDRGWSYGCQHDEVVKHFPELQKYIKWHLTSSNEPMHYIANTIYWAENYNKGGVRNGKGEIQQTAEKCLEYAKESAVWLDADDSEFLPDPVFDLASEPTFKNLEKKLLDRLPALMAEFKSDVEELGFIF